MRLLATYLSKLCAYSGSVQSVVDSLGSLGAEGSLIDDALNQLGPSDIVDQVISARRQGVTTPVIQSPQTKKKTPTSEPKNADVGAEEAEPRRRRADVP